MLFYQFVVSRKSSLAPVSPRPKEARVMLRVDDDVEASTLEAVKYLDDRGWCITGVRRAQHADTPDEFASDDSLMQLYNDAADQGIACAITGLRPSRPAARLALV